MEKKYEYEFIETIMTDKQLKKKPREDFYEKVALPYINDEEFRKKYHGKIVVFTKYKLLCIVKDHDTAYNYPTNKCKMTYYLGDDEEPGAMYNKN